MITLPRSSNITIPTAIGLGLSIVGAGLLIGSFVAVKANFAFGVTHPLILGGFASLVAVLLMGLVLALLAPAGRAMAVMTGGILLLALALTAFRQGTPMGSVAHKATLADGSPAMAAPLSAWGDGRQGFQMHPPYDGAATVDKLRFRRPFLTNSATLTATQPEWALFGADGAPTGGDGVEIVAVGVAGESRTELGRWTLRPAASAQRHWIDWTAQLPDGMTALEVSITRGPGASTTYHDSTFVAVSFGSSWSRLAERGQRLLRVLSVLLPLVAAGYLFIPHLRMMRWQRLASPEAVRLALPIGGLVLAVNVFVAYWTTHGQYIYIWDHFGYWGLVRDLSDTLRQHGLSQALVKVIQSLRNEYNLVAALPPALFGAWLPDIDRRAYVTLLANLYYLPACLAVFWLARVMAFQSAPPGAGRGSVNLLPLVLCAVGLFPVFFKVVLWGQPDIGGVVLAVLAMLLLDAALRGIADGDTPRWNPATLSATLFSQGVLLACVLLLLILFRRWYLFLAAALGLIGFAALLAMLVRAPGQRAERLRRSLTWLTGMGVFLLASVPAFLLDRIMVMLRYSYASAYAAYARDWPGELNFLGEYLGIVPLALALPLLAVGLITPAQRPLPWLALASAPLALALFWTVQRGLGQHHLCLVFLGVTVAMVHGVWLLDRRLVWPMADSFTVLAALLVLTIWTTGNDFTHPAGLPHADLLPPGRDDMAELLRLGHFVGDEMRGGQRRFCVLGSNYTLARDIVAGLWQVDKSPDLRDLERYSINLPQVDTRDGPPDAVKACDLVLVGEPVQTHLAANMQRCVTLPAEDLLRNEGIGAAFRLRPESFQLQNGVTVKVFDRARAITPEEWGEFLQRFNAPR